VHTRSLREDERTTLDGVPITTPARTLYDAARSIPLRQLEQEVAEALARKVATRRDILQMAERYSGRPGAARLRRLVGGDDTPVRTRSEAELLFLDLIRKGQLPAPRVNSQVAHHEVDFFWEAERLVVEIDGFAFHGSRSAFEADRARDATLAMAGIRVMRFTWRQLQDGPHAVLASVARALGPGAIDRPKRRR
jgi:very-short-patch-repair endonuclease